MDNYVIDSSLLNLPKIYHSLVGEISNYIEGHPPLVFASSDPSKIGNAYLSEPGLYPTIVFPQDSDEDWSKVGYGLIHLLRSLNGIPMLAVHGAPMDKKIASDINNEIENHAISNELSKRKLPMPSPVDNLPSQIDSFIENIKDETLNSIITFRALQLCYRSDTEGAEEALKKIENIYPKNVKSARKLHGEIEKCNLSKASGKERACQLAISSLGFEQSHFYMREFGIAKGKNYRFGLGHYQAIERWKNRLVNYYSSSHSYIEFILPFNIPVEVGLYSFKDACMLIEHIELDNQRATWERRNISVEPQVDQTGLYSISKISMVLEGEKQADARNPPVEPVFRIFQSYSPLLNDTLELMNGFLGWVRKKYKRPDIPNINLLHFNRVTIKIFNTSGAVIRNIPLQSNEYTKLTSGPPTAQTKECEIEPAEELEFYVQLLEQAKLDCIETNPRRAILDIFGAFEAFVAYHLSPKMSTYSETTKQRFIRLYKGKLPADVLNLLESNEIKDINDIKYPSIVKIVKEYRRNKYSPELDRRDIEVILKVLDLRNDAAHGRHLPVDMLDKIADAIEAFERLSQTFEERGEKVRPL